MTPPRKRVCTIIRRAEMLAELMRLYSTVSVTGTHGKTTTTSLHRPHLQRGRRRSHRDHRRHHQRLGLERAARQGKWMIVEADESDGTFMQLPTEIGDRHQYRSRAPRLLRLGREHAPRVRDLPQATFPFYGLAVACIDHPVVREMIERLDLRARRPPPADLRHDARTADLVLQVGARRGQHDRTSMPSSARASRAGRASSKAGAFRCPAQHNALNALAAIAVASEAGIADDMIRAAMAGFSGVKRRFQLTGDWNGVAIYDDYGHHPAEIAAVLERRAARCTGRVIAVVEPHRYTRVRDLFDEFAACFKDADQRHRRAALYGGRGADRRASTIARSPMASGRTDTHRWRPSMRRGDLIPAIRRQARPGDMVVCLGRGQLARNGRMRCPIG